MIDIRSHSVISLADAASLLPRRRGKKVHVSTIYRWAQAGLRGQKLETLRIGGRVCTSIEALQAFFIRLSGGEANGGVPGVRTDERARRTEQILREAGLLKSERTAE